MSLATTIEQYAKDIEIDVEQLVDTDFKSFLTAITPLYSDLKNFAVTTGKADVASLLTDLKGDLVSAVSAVAANPLSAGAAIASVAATTLSQVTGAVTGDAKNALYGALAIVATDIPEIVGTAVAPAAASSASGSAA